MRITYTDATVKASWLHVTAEGRVSHFRLDTISQWQHDEREDRIEILVPAPHAVTQWVALEPRRHTEEIPSTADLARDLDHALALIAARD